MRKLLVFLIGITSVFPLMALDLAIGPDDVRIIQSPAGGYHLYIRKKADIRSVLLTETTRDPALRAANYAYRDPDFNPINGNEQRLLDGAFIAPESKIYSLIDSTPESDATLGEAFHIWIPYLIRFGYEWTRNGEVQVLDGTYFNIRAFSAPYADYNGSFQDNPFRLRVTQRPILNAPPEEITYMADTVERFTDLAEKTAGQVYYAKVPADIVPLIQEMLGSPGTQGLDLVIVIDATESMLDDIESIRAELVPMLQEILAGYPSWRIGLVLYKDYFEDFLVKPASPFVSDLTVFRRALGSFRVQGGRDIPEAVYEGLDAALAFPWNPLSDKKIILIGDAPPHPKPRGRVTVDTVNELARTKGVAVSVIILPHGTTY